LGIGFMGRRLRALAPPLLAGWVTCLGAMAVVLAVIYAPADRAGAWWSIRAIGSVSVAMAIVALWQRSPIHVFLSGLLLNAVGVVAWLAWGDAHDIVQLAHVSVLCLAAASAVWTALELLMPQGVPHLPRERRPIVFAHWAAAVGLAIMAALAACGVLGRLQVVPRSRRPLPLAFGTAWHGFRCADYT
jgi:hypothetical protein